MHSAYAHLSQITTEVRPFCLPFLRPSPSHHALISDYGCITTDPDLIAHFQNCEAVVIDDLTDERDERGIFVRDHFNTEDEATLLALAVHGFTIGCMDSRVGLYSNFWTYAAYT